MAPDGVVVSLLRVPGEKLLHIAGNSQPDVRIHINLVDTASGRFLQFTDGNSIGAGQRASQPVDFIHNIGWNRGQAMGCQCPENTLVIQTLPDGHRYLLAQLYILPLDPCMVP